MSVTLQPTMIQQISAVCPHCGGLKQAQVSMDTFGGYKETRIVEGYEVGNYRHMTNFSIDGVWCRGCGTMFHPYSV